MAGTVEGRSGQGSSLQGSLRKFFYHPLVSAPGLASQKSNRKLLIKANSSPTSTSYRRHSQAGMQLPGTWIDGAYIIYARKIHLSRKKIINVF
jgi:hypothetical protein